MLVTIKHSLLVAALIVFAALPVVSSVPAFAIDQASKDAACQGLGSVGGTDCGPGSGAQVNSLIATAINILSWIVGVASVFMIILGGFKYVTSNGDSTAIKSAKDTIMYALIGLVIAVLAQAIVKFVLNKTATAPPAAVQTQTQTTTASPAAGQP